MKGFAKSTRINSAGYEKLVVSLATNQPVHTDINGATVTLNVEGTETRKQWNGSPLQFHIPQGKQYTISFSSVEGYRTPSQVTGTSAPDNTHTISASYDSELVEVNVGTDNGESTNGQKVTLNGKTYTVANGKVTAKVPYGTAYTISTDSRFGFATPSAQSFTASQASRQVTLQYKVNQLKVTISSNQGTDAVIDSLKATVSYSGTSVQVADGETIKIPSATNVTITYPEVGGYKCPASETINAVSGLTTRSVTYQTEVVNVTVTAESGSVAGQVLTIGGVQHTLDANGVVTQKVAFGTSYTISLNAKTDHATPASITRTAGSVSYSTTMQYKINVETVQVTLSADNGASMAGQVVTINGVQHTWNGTTIVQKVAFGTKYTVSVNAKSGYTTPASQTFTASQPSREFSIVYMYNPGITNPTNGVWIRSKDGKYYTSDNWDTNKVADCVAVIADNSRFGIALKKSSNLMAIHSSRDGALENYMAKNVTLESAKRDYDGATNTANIMKLQSSTSYAAGWCASYTFPSGKKGFLPGLGQLHIVHNNISAINTALTTVGGEKFSADDYYWSSTFYDVVEDGGRDCWVHSCFYDSSPLNYLNFKRNVRAFCSL